MQEYLHWKIFEYTNIRYTLMLNVEVTQCFLVSFPFSLALIWGFSSGALAVSAIK